MALNMIVDELYVVDILDYIVIDDGWGMGVWNCRYLA
jgi:hypothetical protein